MFARGRTPLLAVLALSAALTACTDSGTPNPEPTSSPPPLQVVDLEFGVWGTEEEVAAYRDVVEVYDEETDEVNVELTTYATHRELIEAIKRGIPAKEVPVTVVSRLHGHSKKPAVVRYGAGFANAIVRTWLR